MSIINSIIHITNKCSSRCITCDYWKVEKHAHISLREYKKIINQLSKLDIQQVMISGGEPLLHSKIVDIIKFTHKSGIKLLLNTNGVLINDYLDLILKHVDTLIVSLDGSNKDTYLKIRGIDKFNHVISNIIELKKRNPNFNVVFRCTIQKYNLFEINEINSLANSLGCSLGLNPIDALTNNFNREANCLNFDKIVPSNNDIEKFERSLIDFQDDALERDGLSISWDKDKFYKLINYFKYLRSEMRSSIEKDTSVCSIPYTNLIFEATGEVKSCFYHEIAKSFSEIDLAQLVSHECLLNTINELEKSEKCSSCRCKIFC